jgi:hypothetical protein
VQGLILAVMYEKALGPKSRSAHTAGAPPAQFRVAVHMLHHGTCSDLHCLHCISYSSAYVCGATQQHLGTARGTLLAGMHLRHCLHASVRLNQFQAVRLHCWLTHAAPRFLTAGLRCCQVERLPVLSARGHDPHAGVLGGASSTGWRPQQQGVVWDAMGRVTGHDAGVLQCCALYAWNATSWLDPAGRAAPSSADLGAAAARLDALHLCTTAVEDLSTNPPANYTDAADLMQLLKHVLRPLCVMCRSLSWQSCGARLLQTRWRAGCSTQAMPPRG